MAGVHSGLSNAASFLASSMKASLNENLVKLDCPRSGLILVGLGTLCRYVVEGDATLLGVSAVVFRCWTGPLIKTSNTLAEILIRDGR